MVAIVSHKREAIQRAVRDMYTAVATQPQREYHFPTGRRACALLGYPDAQVETLPAAAIESFAGVGYPFAADVIRAGDVVLDIGSGSGTDALLCARLVGPSGRVIGLDMTASMREKLRATASAAGVTNLDVVDGDAESIPLPDASVDVVTSNGVLNLVPDKARAIAEILRVLKPGGRLQIADIALAQPVAERFRQDPQMWAECVVGAVEEERYFAMLCQVGFEQIECLKHFDYFGLSGNAKTREVAGLFNAHAVTLRAVKPAHQPQGARRTRRSAVFSLVGELGGVVAAVLAWLACAGAPALLAAFAAVGATGLAAHAYMLPAFAALLGFSVWLIWRSAFLRGDLRPFWLGAAGAAFAIATFWLSLLVDVPLLGWSSYAGVAGVVGASIWSLAAARQPRDCLAEVRRDLQRRAARGSRTRQLARQAATGVLIAGVLYGLHASVASLAPADAVGSVTSATGR